MPPKEFRRTSDATDSPRPSPSTEQLLPKPYEHTQTTSDGRITGHHPVSDLMALGNSMLTNMITGQSEPLSLRFIPPKTTLSKPIKAITTSMSEQTTARIDELLAGGNDAIDTVLQGHRRPEILSVVRDSIKTLYDDLNKRKISNRPA